MGEAERNGKSAGESRGRRGRFGERGRRERGKWRGGVDFAGVHSELGGMINYRSERAGG